jgi:hypothetical protein
LRLLSGLRSETRSCVHAASSASTRLWSIVPSLLWASLIQDWRLEVRCGQTLDLLQPPGNKGNLVQGHGAADPHLPSLSLVWSLDHPAYNKQCQCSSAVTRGHCPSTYRNPVRMMHAIFPIPCSFLCSVRCSPIEIQPN